MKRHGFTIIELLIVIAIMGILLTLAVANLRSSQVSARDAQREGDVAAIAAAIEVYYDGGNSDRSSPAGTYVSTLTSDATNSTIEATLRDIDPKVLVAPGITDMTYKSLISATNATQTTSGVTPQPDINHFVYQPLQQSGALCTSSTQGCQKFNIYYETEADSVIHMVTSKNQ